MAIILCGLPRSGKTTIGKLLASRLNWMFIDTDRLIEESYLAMTGKALPCRHIFQKEGEALFRSLEKQQIAQLRGVSNAVIATGGGSLGDPENIAVLKSVGTLIYLKLDPKIVWQRVRREKTPAYLKDPNQETSFYRLAALRMPIYEMSAQVIIEVEGFTKMEIVDSVLALVARLNTKLEITTEMAPW